MKVAPLTPNQRELQRLGKLGISIRESQKAAETRTATYYDRLFAAVEKGDTVEIQTLNKEHRKGEKGVMESLREQQAYIADRWQQVMDKVIAQ